MALCRWLPRFDSDLTQHTRKQEVLGATTSLLIQGLLIATRLAQLLRASVGGHFELATPLSQKSLVQVLGAFELLKNLQSAIDKRSGRVALTAMHAARACASQIRIPQTLRSSEGSHYRTDPSHLYLRTAYSHGGIGPHAPHSRPPRNPCRQAAPVDARRRARRALRTTVEADTPREVAHRARAVLVTVLVLLMRGPTTSLDSARCLQTLAQATNASMLLFARDILPPMISIASELPTPRLRTLFDVGALLCQERAQPPILIDRVHQVGRLNGRWV